MKKIHLVFVWKGDLDYDVSSENGEKWWSSGYVLDIELSEFADMKEESEDI